MLHLEKENKQLLILIIVAMSFSFLLRLIWVEYASEYEHYYFNKQFMINTNDGYYFAEGARDILSGVSQENDLSPIDNALSITTAFFVKLLPFSFESIIFYMPAIFSSLVVIPLILIGSAIKHIETGFIAALLASITWSYYNRTMVGYYDTDMLNVVFPTFLLWSLIQALQKKEDKYFLITAFIIIAYKWWYPQSYSLEFAFTFIIIVFILYKIWKKQDFSYEILLLSFMFLAMMGIEIIYSFLAILMLYLLEKKNIIKKHYYIILIVSILLFFLSDGLEPVIGKIKSYLFLQELNSISGDIKLYFYSVKQTIREAGQIPFGLFANRISGHMISFLLGLVGFIWLIYKHKVMFLALPMLILGFAAYIGGLRFTVYAVPILALGVAFLLREIVFFFVQKLWQRYILLILGTALLLVPNILHIIEYKVPTVFTKQEVKVLDKLHSMAKREDYVVAWWDYGYPIRYYTDVKTLIDGGKHSGSDNFSVSYALTQQQKQSAKILRLDVEYTEKEYAQKKQNISTMAQILKEYGYSNSNSFLDSLLLDDYRLPEKTRDIYLMLPHKMLDIYATVERFSNLDLMNGKKGEQSFLYRTRNFSDRKGSISLGQDIILDKKKGNVVFGGKEIPIKLFIETRYMQDGSLRVNSEFIHHDGLLYVVYMRSYGEFIIVDSNVYNSTYFQLFVLENYNKQYYEPLLLDPYIKIYKVKI